MPTPRSSRLSLTWPQSLVLAWALLTALFWALNPSATEGYGAGLRLAFWAVHVATPLILCQVAQVLIVRYLTISDWSAVLVSGVIGGLAFLPVALLLDTVFPDGDGSSETWSELIGEEAGSTFFPVVLAWLVINAPRLASVAPSRARENRNTAPGFLKKLPSDLGENIAALSAELHYLRVYTDAGDTLVLYPFGRAVAEMDEAKGQQIHRSHWVAFASIVDVERKGEGARVAIRGDVSLPVSRRYRNGLLAKLSSRQGV